MSDPSTPLPRFFSPSSRPDWVLGRADLAPPAGARPLLGNRVTCGFPSPAEDHMAEDLDLNTRCIRNPVATYFVEADTGESMLDFGIGPGDTLVVDRSISPDHGDVVMVLWEGGYMVKQLWLKAGGVQLRSGNAEHRPIIVPPDVELLVWGVVTWSFRRQLRR